MFCMAETQYEYDLFISYATSADFRLARGLESFLESFHRLPNPGAIPLKELKICRDGSDFQITGEAGQIQHTIDHYLARSRGLLVLCSGKAHASEWVNEEVRWFLRNRGESTIRAALTEGVRLERLEQEVFPPALIEAQVHRKIGYDFRGFRGRSSRSWESVRLFDDERTRLAADLNGRSLGEVQPIWFGEQRRRTRRKMLSWMGVAVAMFGLAIFALYQRSDAIAQAERTRRQLFVTRMNLAQRAWNDGSADLVRDTLLAQQPQNGQKDLRDFDWFHMSRRVNAEVGRLATPGVALQSVSISMDGKLAAVAGRLWSEDKANDPSRVVYVWSLDSGKLVWRLPGHSESVTAVAFSPVAAILVSASAREVKFWDVLDGREIRTIDAPFVDHLVFSPDGELLAMASVGAISIRDIGGHELGVLDVSTERLGRLAFSPDGKKIVVGDSHGHVRLWDVDAKRQIRILGRHKGEVTTACWLPKSDRVATGAQDHEVIVWDVNGEGEPYSLPQSDAVLSLAANSSGDLLAVGLGHSLDLESGQVIALWHLPTHTQRSTLRGSGRRIKDMAFTPDGKKLASVAEEELVRIWDSETALFVRPLRSQSQIVWSLSFSSDGNQLAAAGGDGAVELWDVEMERMTRRPRIHDWRTEAVSIDPKGRFVASTGFDRSIQIWNSALTAPAKQLVQTERGFTSVAFSPDGSKLAAASCDGNLYLWRTEGFQPLPGLHEDACLTFVAWSADNSTIATGGGDPANMQSPKSVFVRRADGKEPAIALAGHRDWPRCAAFSADGSLLAIGDWSGEVTLWDLATRQRRAVFRGHRGLVTGVAFSPLGNVIASASSDKTVRIWDVNTAQERVVLSEAAKELYDVKFRPDGKALAAAGADDMILIWLGDTK